MGEIAADFGWGLWWTPEARLAERLGPWRRLAAGPDVAPHVTLCSGFADGRAARAALRQLGTVPAPAVRFDAVEIGPTPFRALALRIGEGAGILRALRSRLTGAPGPPPHLSLVYGEPDSETLAQVCEQVRPALPLSGVLDGLELWRLSGRVSEWRREARWELRRSGP